MKVLIIIPPPSLPLHKETPSLPFALNPQFSLQFPPLFPLPKQHNTLSNPMATCIDTCRTEVSQSNPLSRDPNRTQYGKFCRPICQNLTILDDTDQQDDYQDLWLKIKEEARSDVEQEPILSSYYYNSILIHNSLEIALANHLATKLSNPSLPTTTLFDLFLGILVEDLEIMKSVKKDLRAVKERDPACTSYVHCFLHFKGFLACQSHRIAHKLWTQNRKTLALLIQNRVSEIFAVDIHPGAKFGAGILLDHATGVVIGETAVVGNNVSILHNVTLGGTGKDCGDRHPKIGDGVLIGAGTCVLGNVWIGDGAKIGAGSVVLKEVPPRTTAVGNPARLIGGKENPIRLEKIPGFTMDHISHICEWSDYVI